MQAGTTFKLIVRSCRPLTETLASQQASAPRPFGRAVFLFDYADSDLLHSLEGAIRGQNAVCLGLFSSPGALAARARASSPVPGAGNVMLEQITVLTLAQDRLPFQCMFGRSPGTKARGEPRDTWQTTVYKDLISFHAQFDLG